MFPGVEYAEVAAVAGFLSFCIFAMISLVSKLRCRSNQLHPEDRPLALSTELLQYAYYLSGCAWCLAESITLAIEHELWVVSPVFQTTMIIGEGILGCAHHYALDLIMIDRLSSSFKHSAMAFSNRTIYTMHCLIATIWFAMSTFFSFGIAAHDHWDIHILPDHSPRIVFIVAMIFNLIFSLTFCLIFIGRLRKFNDAVKRQDYEGPFLLLIQQQQMLLLWISLSHILIIGVEVATLGTVGWRLPSFGDAFADAVGVFISLSVNKKWFLRCKGHLCVRFLCHRECPCSPTLRSPRCPPAMTTQIELSQPLTPEREQAPDSADIGSTNTHRSTLKVEMNALSSAISPQSTKQHTKRANDGAHPRTQSATTMAPQTSTSNTTSISLRLANRCHGRSKTAGHMRQPTADDMAVLRARIARVNRATTDVSIDLQPTGYITEHSQYANPLGTGCTPESSSYSANATAVHEEASASLGSHSIFQDRSSRMMMLRGDTGHSMNQIPSDAANPELKESPTISSQIPELAIHVTSSTFCSEDKSTRL